MYEELAPTRRTLRVAVVTETYSPELNGVAVTAERFVEGLRRLEHQIQLIRPRQGAVDTPGKDDVLVRGVAIPYYPDLKLGLPAKRALERLWSMRRPDVVHLVTEGPLGFPVGSVDIDDARRIGPAPGAIVAGVSPELLALGASLYPLAGGTGLASRA